MTSAVSSQPHDCATAAASTNPVVLPFDPGRRGEAGEGFEAVAGAVVLLGGEVQDAI